MTLEEKLKNLPTAPGVYLHKNADGKIIYVGKAKNLKNRVRSYFQSNRGHDRKTRELVKRIADLEFIVVDNGSRSVGFRIESDQKTQTALQHFTQRRQTISAFENDERTVSESRHHAAKSSATARIITDRFCLRR